MYNRYISRDKEAFDDLYSYVESPKENVDFNYDEGTHVSKPYKEKKPLFNMSGFLDFKKILKGFHFDDFGIIPILLLLFLVLDVDDEEKLIIIGLAFLFGL